MTIDLDVAVAAKYWGLDPTLIQSVVRAEGNIVRAVQCSVPTVQTRAEAIDILCRSCAHALSDFVRREHATDFVHFWAQRWAPVGADNDPHGLNENWPTNVLAGWLA